MCLTEQDMQRHGGVSEWHLGTCKQVCVAQGQDLCVLRHKTTVAFECTEEVGLHPRTQRRPLKDFRQVWAKPTGAGGSLPYWPQPKACGFSTVSLTHLLSCCLGMEFSCVDLVFLIRCDFFGDHGLNKKDVFSEFLPTGFIFSFSPPLLRQIQRCPTCRPL